MEGGICSHITHRLSIFFFDRVKLLIIQMIYKSIKQLRVTLNVILGHVIWLIITEYH